MRQRRIHAVCDIESMRWIHFVVIGLFNGQKFRWFPKMSLFLEHILESKITHIWAHNGGGFDFNFIIQAILENYERGTIQNMVPRGSKLLFFDFVVGKRKIRFMDSCGLLKYKLLDLTDFFKVKHRKIDAFDSSKITKITPEVLEYLEYDCRGLYEVLQKFKKWPVIQKVGLKTTIASQSFAIWHKSFNKKIHSVPKGVDRFIRPGYIGGRVEIFKPIYSSKKPLYCYDVNSLFPSQMLGPMPFYYKGWVFKYDKKFQGFWECKVRVPKMKIPPLGIVIKGKLIFPIGDFWGVFSTCEIEYLKELGGEILEFKKGITFESEPEPFKKYVTFFWNLRQKTKKGSVDNLLSKLFLNSLYGRTGIKCDRDILTFDEGEKEFTPIRDFDIKGTEYTLGSIPKYIKAYSNVAIAATITAQSRIHVHKILTSIEDDVYYTDTDSFFTTKKMDTGPGLGELKEEYKCNSACFLLPKTYCVEGQFKKVVMKGFNNEKIKDFTFEDFTFAFRGQLEKLKIIQPPKFLTIRSALVKGKLLAMSEANTRQIRTIYDKRILIQKNNNKWDTKPIKIN